MFNKRGQPQSVELCSWPHSLGVKYSAATVSVGGRGNNKSSCEMSLAFSLSPPISKFPHLFCQIHASGMLPKLL